LRIFFDSIRDEKVLRMGVESRLYGCKQGKALGGGGKTKPGISKLKDLLKKKGRKKRRETMMGGCGVDYYMN
jgi:hypothetical protein